MEYKLREGMSSAGIIKGGGKAGLVLFFSVWLSLGGCAIFGGTADVDAPVIADFQITPSEMKAGEPLTYTFTIVSAKAPVKTVVVEWVRTAPKRWNPGPSEIKNPARFIQNGRFSYTSREGKFASYGGQLAVFAVSVYVIDEQEKKSNTLSIEVKQR